MKNKLNRKQFSYLLVAILIVVFLGNQGYTYIQPRWFPKKEDLNITMWSTHTEFYDAKPLFTIQYPTGWTVKTTGSGGSGPHTEIRSPWNKKNNAEENFVYIDIFWDTKKGWSGSGDPVLGSDLNNKKVPITDANFTMSKVDGHDAIIAHEDYINKKYFNSQNVMSNSIYFFIDKPLFKSDLASPENNAIFRIMISFNTGQNSDKIEKIFTRTINSFNYLE